MTYQLHKHKRNVSSCLLHGEGGCCWVLGAFDEGRSGLIEEDNFEQMKEMWRDDIPDRASFPDRSGSRCNT